MTGGFGFIGSTFIKGTPAAETRNLDADTYAADRRRLEGPLRVDSLKVDVASTETMAAVAAFKPQVVVHFAAETHVTRSETRSETFYRTNVAGTERLLSAAERSGCTLFVHVSTDEVYGSCEGAPFRENDKEPGEGRATSAYARSKALADDLALSRSDRLPVIVVRPTNCFGPFQHPEKAVARWTARAARGMRLPVWGDGEQVRDWMYVDDCCDAIRLLIEKGTPGEAYNVAPEGAQISNLQLAKRIARAAGSSEDTVYRTTYDRPNHDVRYAIDATKLRALGWQPSHSIDRRLVETVSWYRAHEHWWAPLIPDAESLYSDDQERTP